MKVRVIDREAMARLWGTPHYHVVIVPIEIADTCPRCGGPRGKPTTQTFYESGDWHTVSRWFNPCLHVDTYVDALAEAARLRAA